MARVRYMLVCFFFLMILVAGLPKWYASDFTGARAVTSESGNGAVVQMGEHFYELNCEIIGCSWSILAQNLDLGAAFTVVMTLPPDYTSKCDSCKAGFFGDFCEGR